MLIGYQAVGNYGRKIFLKNAKKHPRGQLLEVCGRKHCQKIYRDTETGPKHIGYIVDREWFVIQEVHSWAGNSNF
jgi:hypothetical protein